MHDDLLNVIVALQMARNMIGLRARQCVSAGAHEQISNKLRAHAMGCGENPSTAHDDAATMVIAVPLNAHSPRKLALVRVVAADDARLARASDLLAAARVAKLDCVLYALLLFLLLKLSVLERRRADRVRSDRVGAVLADDAVDVIVNVIIVVVMLLLLLLLIHHHR